MAATGASLPWPASESRVKVVAHHLVRPAQEQAGGYPRCARSSARQLFIDRLADTRDLAILLLAFAGRRRSEVARPAVPLDPRDPKSPCLAIQLGRTKTGDADEAGRVLLVGPPVEALREWLDRADITKGPISGPSIAGRRWRRGR